jgi:hypothetical protein
MWQIVHAISKELSWYDLDQSELCCNKLLELSDSIMWGTFRAMRCHGLTFASEIACHHGI